MAVTREVLVVEDDPSTRSLLGAVAAHNGFRPIYAHDGTAALVQLAGGFSGLILLDLIMPGTDGFTVVRQMKKSDPALLRRTIVVTAAAEFLLRSCPELSETWKVFRKPIDVRELATVLLACAAQQLAIDPTRGKGSERDTR